MVTLPGKYMLKRARMADHNSTLMVKRKEISHAILLKAYTFLFKNCNTAITFFIL